MSKIEWTDKTWNPITGCSWISPGCDNCYAKTMANRLQHNPKMKHKYRNNFKVTCHPEELKRKFPGKGKKIFVCSMGDLFHKDVSFHFIKDVFKKIKDNPQHTFQILTKRPARMNAIFCNSFSWLKDLDNVWFGVTAENQEQFDNRVETLIDTSKIIKRFVSIEPMLEKIDLSWALDTMCLYCGGTGQQGPTELCGHCKGSGQQPNLNWVIVGGETGPKARPMNPEWARTIRDQCQDNGIPFFFKQMSKKQPIPDDLNIKEFPEVKPCQQ